MKTTKRKVTKYVQSKMSTEKKGLIEACRAKREALKNKVQRSGGGERSPHKYSHYSLSKRTDSILLSVVSCVILIFDLSNTFCIRGSILFAFK